MGQGPCPVSPAASPQCTPPFSPGSVKDEDGRFYAVGQKQCRSSLAGAPGVGQRRGERRGSEGRGMSDDETIVFFDLETTGLDTSVCDIIQLSAICGDKVFNVYTLPRNALTQSATEVTGFTVSDGRLFLHGVQMRTTPLVEALTSFIAFLRSFRRPVVLVAHNAKRFDAPVLSRVLQNYSLWQQFQQVVSRFLDTFLLSKNLFRNLSSYSQVYMVDHFLGLTYDAHNALEDARMLQKLYNTWRPKSSDVSRCTFRTTAVFL
ncbi:hypothetical protein Q5P01_012816 [Channa striata]|uniref:exodeoxyribonuclease III n=1 Tax=Channa striata TaxID=64152 RepID=A0AA88SKP1_CHASR|nr:hypothetical protein Q5P01_012816 [Channa striata]